MAVSAYAAPYEDTYESRIKDYDDLMNATKIKLTVEKGTTGKWIDGKLKMMSEKWAIEKGGQFIIDDIDLENKTATMVGKNGTSNLSVYKTSAGLHFTELSSFGSPLYLTVYAKRISATKFVFVYSRHMKIVANPLPSQWYGECEILN